MTAVPRKTYVHVNLARGYRGGERQTLLLVESLACQPIAAQVYLVCHPSGELAKRAAQLKDVKCVFARSQLCAHFSVYRLKPNLVHAHEARAVHWAFIHWSVFNTPYVITRRIQQPPKQHWFTKRCYQKAVAVVAISSAIAQCLRVYGVEVSTIISSAVPARSISAKTSWARVDASIFKIMCAAALDDRQKGQSVLIDAMAKLPSDVKVTFLGDGPDKAFLEELVVRANRTEQVEFLPWCDNFDQLFQSFDLFVLPSRNEGLGSILVDAMQLGVPIVATNVGGIPDLIKNEITGLLAEGCSAENLAYHIARMYDSETLREQLARQAVKSAEDLTSDIMCGRYVRLYDAVIAE